MKNNAGVRQRPGRSADGSAAEAPFLSPITTSRLCRGSGGKFLLKASQLLTATSSSYRAILFRRQIVPQQKHDIERESSRPSII
jgi:hypothetical protein